MISVTSMQLEAWLAAFIFPLARILALVASAPVLGNKQVPARVKVGFAMLITFVVAPTLNIQPDIEVGSGMGLFILAQQIMAGLAMGFSMRLIFTAIEMAGDLMGMQMGLGFANFYDPINFSNTQVVAQFLGIVAALAFLSMNGHLYMLATLVESFQAFPISTNMPSASAMHTLALWGGSIFSQALHLSLPLIGALLITNLTIGILTRSAPQLNIFAIGFPITLTIGFATLLLTLPYLNPLLDTFTQAGQDTMLKIARELGKH
ncbi:MAG: flagellar biosynthetic protein FliR [Gallionellaceae bacterium]|jgi:flagellar biosynthetic protein FliR